MPVILISYRRADSKEIAGRIRKELVSRYGKNLVFIDTDSAQPSADYRGHIMQDLERALVMVAVIGRDWAGPRAEGRPRIFDADDPVRAEVETAFANRCSVLPVLVNGAGMPTEADLPESLRQLPYLNAIVIRSEDEFSSDMERLFRAIGQLSAQFWTLFTSAYLVLPFALVLLSQYLILFKIDTNPMYLRLAVAAISMALGIGLCFHIRFRTVATLITGATVGFASAIGMIAAVTALSSSTSTFSIWNFLPADVRDWQEVWEYFTIITVVTLGTNVMGWLYRDRRTPRSGRAAWFDRARARASQVLAAIGSLPYLAGEIARHLLDRILAIGDRGGSLRTAAAIALVIAPALIALSVQFELARGSRLLIDPTVGRAHKEEITSIVFNGQSLATSSYDGTIKFWDLSSGKLTRTISAGPASTKSDTKFGDTMSPLGAITSVYQAAPLAISVGVAGRISAITGAGPASDDGKGGLEVEPIVGTLTSPNGASVLPYSAYLLVARGISSPYTIARNWFAGTSLATTPFVTLALFGDAYALGVADGRVAIETGYPTATSSIHETTPPRGSPSHQGAVTALAANKDGKLASVADDGSVILWAINKGQFGIASALIAPIELAASLILSGHEDSVRLAAFSPDATRIVTASDDKTARLWDAKTGALIATLTGHTGPVYSAAFSPDTTRIVTASADNTARLWDGKTGALIATLTGHTGPVYSAAFSPDTTRIVTASADNTARLWDGKTGAELAILRGHTGPVHSAEFSPDGAVVLTASSDRTARLWDAKTGAMLRSLGGNSSIVTNAMFSPDGRHILTTSRDKTARLWDTETGAVLATLTGHTDVVTAAAFSPDATRIVTASDDKTARLWDAKTGALIATLTGHTGPVYSAAFSPDTTRIVTASADNTARLWDGKTGAALATLSGHSGGVNGAAFSPDDTRIVTASADKTARIWLNKSVTSDACPLCSSAEFSANGERLVTAGWGGTAQVWDVQTGNLVRVLKHGAAINVARLSDDGNTVITAGDDGASRVWDASSGSLLAVVRGHGEAITQAELTPDGTALVTASRDGSVRVNSLGQAELLHHVDFVPAYRRYVVPAFAMATTGLADLKETWRAHLFLLVLIAFIGSAVIAILTTSVFAQAGGALLDTGEWILGAFADVLEGFFRSVRSQTNKKPAVPRKVVHSSRLWALFHSSFTRLIFPERMIADDFGVSLKRIKSWYIPWEGTDELLSYQHIAQVTRHTGLLWDSIAVESTLDLDPLVVHNVSKWSARRFVEHLRDRLD